MSTPPRPRPGPWAALLAAFAAACGPAGEPVADGAPDRLRVAVVPKGTTHQFWTAVERGARRAGEELGVEVLFQAQLDEGDRAGQIQVVEQLVSRGVDALCIAPLDSRALVRPLADARAAGVPVLLFDSPLAEDHGLELVGYVGTDNRAAGRAGARALVEAMGGAGRVVLLRYRVGSASTLEREEGFLAELAGHEGVEVLVDDRYAGATVAEAQGEALALIDRLREADGAFASAEPATLGLLLALRREGLLEDLALVGFDASPPLVEALAAGELDALVVQDPVRMGALSVELAVRHLRGETVPPVTDTGAVVVTAADLTDERVRELLE